MSPILNPTAPAFSPPVSIPRLASPFISSTSVPAEAVSASAPNFFRPSLELDLALETDLNGTETPISETSKVAISLLGESLLKAVFQSPSSPYSPIDEDDEYDDHFLPSPHATASTPSSVRDVWSPTVASCSTSETLDSPFSSVLSLPDEDVRRATKCSASPQGETWGVSEDWSRDDDYPSQGMSSRLISMAPVANESPLKFGFHSNSPSPVFSAMQLQLSWQRQSTVYPPNSSIGFSPQLQSQPAITPSLQFIHVPPVPTPKTGLAPLWPLISALHRNLSRSRPDLYGTSPPSAYL